jgi:hypothetical protein
VDPGSIDERLVSLIDLGPTMLSITGSLRPQHLQGQPFLGPDAEPRQYIFATRDRHDEFYDRVRAVRDQRYKYLRHYHPEQPYLPWNPYRNRHPVMQEMWRLYRQDALEGAQRLLFDSPRPPEELYDTRADPFEMINLADDPAYRRVLARLRGALNEWQTDVGDLGDMAEEEMVYRWWPQGVQPQTAMVGFVPFAAQSAGLELSRGGSFDGPCRLQLHCPTQGASMTYTFDAGQNARWRLYTGPIELPRGTTTVRARAVRIGYLDSTESEGDFTVRSSDPGAVG